MLLEKSIIFNTANTEHCRELIESKCTFKKNLFGIYFYDDDSGTIFEGKYKDNELCLYYKGIKRNFFNPMITINYFDNKFKVKISYNNLNKIAVFVFTLIFLILGIPGIGNQILSFLPLIVFWILLLISFEFYSRKIINVFNELIT